MNDFQRIAFSQKDDIIRVARHNLAISLDDDTTGAYLELLKQTGNAQSVGNFFVFAVNLDFHKNKNRTHVDHSRVTREYGLK